ncbi:MAG: hypothetical protein PHV93_04540 [Candidatus Pacebacteria bacterium]|nr:hypothetical protein [Candidatus Paceibacterota bacterium]
MAKDLPFFKFTPDEWINGDITLEEMEIQGIFINICAYYWKRDCSITMAHLCSRYKYVTESQWQTLLSKNLIKKDKYENVRINFLDEQLSELQDIENKRIAAGKAGAKARWQTHTIAKSLPLAKNGYIDIDIEIEYIYTLYPSRDKNNDNRSTGKCSKDKRKIAVLLKKHGKDKLSTIIKAYLVDCETNKVYLKNFGTFLNQLPEIPPQEKQQIGWKVKI